MNVAAGECLDCRRASVALDREAADQVVGELAHGLAAQNMILLIGFFIVTIRNDVVFNAGIARNAVGHSVLGNMRHAHLPDLADGMSLDALTFDEDLAALDLIHAGDHLGDLALAVALDARDT